MPATAGDQMIFAGWRSALANRFFLEASDDHSASFAHLSDPERAAFKHGYLMATRDMMLVVGTAIATMAFCFACFSPALHLPLRRLVRPWTLRHVASGRWVIEAVQRLTRHPMLDRLHALCSLSCGIEFYITFLPFLFWVGEVRLARLTTIFMALCIYVGNAVKDTVCAPRPTIGSKAGHTVVLVGRHTDVDGSGLEQEYGLPSTHTINTVCLAFYLLHWVSHWPAAHTAPTASLAQAQAHYPWLFDSLFVSGNVTVQLATVLAVTWCLFIMWGRLYLGMHSPVDLLAGLVIGAACLGFFIPIEDFVDAWIVGGRAVPVYQLVFDVALVFAYPRPERRTPSYNYALYFIAVTFGVVCGTWHYHRQGLFHTSQAAAAMAVQRGDLFTLGGAWWTLRRFVVGIAVVVASMTATKELAKLVVPVVANAIPGVTADDHDALASAAQEARAKAKAVSSGKGGGRRLIAEAEAAEARIDATYNLRVPIRFLTYSVVGFSVVGPAFLVFDYFGI